MSNKAIVLFSGGIDSTTLLGLVAKKFENVFALSVNYGQRHNVELVKARMIVSHYNTKFHNIEHVILDISEMSRLLRSSALINIDEEIPHLPEKVEHYETLKHTIVPNRNMTLLSIACAYAISIGANDVFISPHANDRGVYPDCRKEFIDSFNKTVKIATDNPKLKVHAPFVNFSKAKVVKTGEKEELTDAYKYSWSCYEGGLKHCGECSSCRERKRAFKKAKVLDPTVYYR